MKATTFVTSSIFMEGLIDFMRVSGIAKVLKILSHFYRRK